MASTTLPPLPKGDTTSNGPSTPDGAAGSSAFAGGLPGIMQYAQMVEQGYQGLVQMLPSMAPLAAEAISKLRTTLPSAVGATAGQGPAPGSPAVNGSQSLPIPPAQG